VLTNIKRCVYEILRHVRSLLEIMKRLFVLGGFLALTLNAQIASAQPLPLKPDFSVTTPSPETIKKIVPNPAQIVYDRPPSMYLIQNRNLLVFDSGIGDKIEKISVRTGGPGLQSKKGIYDIPFISRDPVYFAGWDSLTLFGDNVWMFVPKGRTLADMISKREFVGAGHTQPRHCAGLQNYLGKLRKWSTLTNQFLKENDNLQSDPVSFNKAYSLFKNMNPKPNSPCSKAPDRAWGSSHGCIRVDGVTAPLIMTWMEFHRANGKPLTLYIDQRPPSLPASYQP
jgi:hypothetical protein